MSKNNYEFDNVIKPLLENEIKELKTSLGKHQNFLEKIKRWQYDNQEYISEFGQIPEHRNNELEKIIIKFEES